MWLDISLSYHYVMNWNKNDANFMTLYYFYEKERVYNSQILIIKLLNVMRLPRRETFHHVSPSSRSFDYSFCDGDWATVVCSLSLSSDIRDETHRGRKLALSGREGSYFLIVRSPSLLKTNSTWSVYRLIFCSSRCNYYLNCKLILICKMRIKPNVSVRIVCHE